MIRRMLLALATGLAAVGLLVAPQTTPKAEATSISVAGVGTMTGVYYPSPSRDYEGYFRPYAGQCVEVQRLSGGGDWTTNYVWSADPSKSPTNCNSNLSVFWQITNDAKVSDTFGIRLFNYNGSAAGTSARVCRTKTECLAMR